MDQTTQRPRRRVLLVTDDPIERLLLGRMLPLLDVEHEAVDGLGAAAGALRAGGCDAVLLDLRLLPEDPTAPGSRLDTLGAALPTGPPVVALVAAGGQHGARSSPRIRAVLERPVSLDALRSCLDGLGGRPAAVEVVAPVAVEPVVVEPARLDDLAEQLGCPEPVLEVVAAYLGALDGRAEHLRAAVASHDAAAMHGVAHSLKSSSALVGAVGLAEHGRRLELLGADLEAGRSATSPDEAWASAETEAAAVARHLEPTRAALAAWSPRGPAVDQVVGGVAGAPGRGQTGSKR